ncbi:MAG TPA: biopolymer transporter ExbD [Prosthecobacter sp.]|nr:biopolymer transporter ExbD [Prosthecobacter sp.]HRK17284.1 biopolymer transporter ExbD [Prosthecobacter sp.]
MNLRPRRRPVPMIPIVSLVDVMVILLIFFVATTTFRNEKTQVKITLPESRTMGEPVPQAEVRKAITITREQELFLDGSPVQPDALADALKRLKAQSPAVRLELEADTGTALGVLMKVWDALRAAGYSVNDVPARIQRAP